MTTRPIDSLIERLSAVARHVGGLNDLRTDVSRQVQRIVELGAPAEIDAVGYLMEAQVGGLQWELRTAIDHRVRELHDLLIDRHHETMAQIRQRAIAGYAATTARLEPTGEAGQLSEAGRQAVELITANPVAEPRFLDGDELDEKMRDLAKEFPGLFTEDVIGESTWERPISAFTLHGGPEVAVVVGYVHANEPVCSITTPYLARLLAANDDLREQLGYTWIFIPCIDPDNVILNKWIAATYTRNREEYRPDVEAQPTWSLPCRHKGVEVKPTLKEMLALKGVLDRHQDNLALVVELHNSESGAYCLQSEGARDLPREVSSALTGDLSRIPGLWGIPVIRNPQEEINLHPPAIAGVIDAFDGWTTPTGQPLAGYVAPTVPVLLPELPLFAHPAQLNQAPCGRTFGDVVREDYLPVMRETAAVVDRCVRQAQGDLARSKNLAMAKFFVSELRAIADRAEREIASPAADRQATVSEEHDIRDWALGLYTRRAVLAGRRAFEVGLKPEPSHQALAAYEDLLDHELVRARQAEDVTGLPVPKGDAAGAQTALVLTFATHVRNAKKMRRQPRRWRR